MWTFIIVIGAISFAVTVWGFYQVIRQSKKHDEPRPEIYNVEDHAPSGPINVEQDAPRLNSTGPIGTNWDAGEQKRQVGIGNRPDAPTTPHSQPTPDPPVRPSPDDAST